MIFPVGYKQIALVFSVNKGECHGLELLDGRSADDRGNPSTRKPGIIQNGRRYTALVGVRVKGDKATIDVVFNGKKYMRTFGTLDGLSLPARWDLNNPACAGLGADQAAVKFSKVRIRMVDGKASPRPAERVRANTLLPACNRGPRAEAALLPQQPAAGQRFTPNTPGCRPAGHVATRTAGPVPGVDSTSAGGNFVDSRPGFCLEST